MNLPEAATWLSTRWTGPTGCVALRTKGVYCWGNPTAPQPIVGVAPLTRAVVGGSGSGCALSGSHTVQCWGSNYYGALAREGPASSTAVVIPFKEPIADLTGGGGPLCVRFVSGRAACWGYNVEGNYAPILRESVTPLLVEQ